MVMSGKNENADQQHERSLYRTQDALSTNADRSNRQCGEALDQKKCREQMQRQLQPAVDGIDKKKNSREKKDGTGNRDGRTPPPKVFDTEKQKDKIGHWNRTIGIPIPGGNGNSISRSLASSRDDAIAMPLHR